MELVCGSHSHDNSVWSLSALSPEHGVIVKTASQDCTPGQPLGRALWQRASAAVKLLRPFDLASFTSRFLHLVNI